MSQPLSQPPILILNYQSLSRRMLSPLRRFVWIITLVTGSITVAAALALDFYLRRELDGFRNFDLFTTLLATLPPLVGLTQIACSVPISKKSRLATNLALAATTLQLMAALACLAFTLFALFFVGDFDRFLDTLLFTALFAVIVIIFAAITFLLVESRRELPLRLDPLRFTDAQYTAALHRDANRPSKPTT